MRDALTRWLHFIGPNVPLNLAPMTREAIGTDITADPTAGRRARNLSERMSDTDNDKPKLGMRAPLG
ncbi:hypothetical protein JW805_20605 [Roseomonas aeriglobus]|nr:hypothetical protein [Roseomonas aeriglobus]